MSLEARIEGRGGKRYPPWAVRKPGGKLPRKDGHPVGQHDRWGGQYVVGGYQAEDGEFFESLGCHVFAVEVACM